MPDALGLVIVLVILGLLVGSFLNVVIARVPEGQSIVTPASRCPRCGAQLRWRDNIPLVSWSLLHGRCRSCAAPISVRYPLVEAGNALLWLLLTLWALGDGSRLSLLPLLLVLSSAGLALAVIDIEHHRLPDAIVLPLYPVTAVGLVLNEVCAAEGHWLPAMCGAAIWGATIGGLWLITGGSGMGLGDVKLAPLLGAVLGWLGIAEAVIGLFAAFALGAIIGLVLIVARRRARRSRMAFGPFLLGGALLALLFGARLWDVYVRAMGL